MNRSLKPPGIEGDIPRERCGITIARLASFRGTKSNYSGEDARRSYAMKKIHAEDRSQARNVLKGENRQRTAT